MNLSVLDVVALLEPVEEAGLVRGQVGTILERWPQDVYEVEFCGEDGVPYATASIEGKLLLKLKHQLDTETQ